MYSVPVVVAAGSLGDESAFVDVRSSEFVRRLLVLLFGLVLAGLADKPIARRFEARFKGVEARSASTEILDRVVRESAATDRLSIAVDLADAVDHCRTVNQDSARVVEERWSGLKERVPEPLGFPHADPERDHILESSEDLVFGVGFLDVFPVDFLEAFCVRNWVHLQIL
mgnify:CR=1 FL=1